MFINFPLAYLTELKHDIEELLEKSKINESKAHANFNSLNETVTQNLKHIDEAILIAVGAQILHNACAVTESANTILNSLQV